MPLHAGGRVRAALPGLERLPRLSLHERGLLYAAHPARWIYADTVAGGELRPDTRRAPACLGIMLLIAVPVYVFDRLMGTNYMFLNWAVARLAAGVVRFSRPPWLSAGLYPAPCRGMESDIRTVRKNAAPGEPAQLDLFESLLVIQLLCLIPRLEGYIDAELRTSPRRRGRG